MSSKVRIDLEFPIHASPSFLFPSVFGLSEIFEGCLNQLFKHDKMRANLRDVKNFSPYFIS